MGKSDQALKWYSQSLRIAETKSVNFIRLQALENIEIIIRHKRLYELQNIVPELRHKKNKKMMKAPQLWSRRNMIYKYLSHHYIMQRSVVFIVDPDLSS